MSDSSSSSRPTKPLNPDKVRFVLVEPQFGGNVGSAARALKNLGFSRLSLVRPHCDPGGAEAHRMAVEASDLLRRAETHDDLAGALAGAGAVVGTTRRTGRQRRPHRRLDECAEELAGLAKTTDLAVLFGREDHGLSDQDLDRTTHLVFLPTAIEYPSLNLAQAVLLVAYELRMKGLALPDAHNGPPPPATHEEREGLYRHLEQALRTIGFLTPETAEAMMRRLRRMLGRAGITGEDAALFRGIARQVLWTARRAGLPVARGPEPRERAAPERSGGEQD